MLVAETAPCCGFKMHLWVEGAARAVLRRCRGPDPCTHDPAYFVWTPPHVRMYHTLTLMQGHTHYTTPVLLSPQLLSHLLARSRSRLARAPLSAAKGLPSSEAACDPTTPPPCPHPCPRPCRTPPLPTCLVPMQSAFSLPRSTQTKQERGGQTGRQPGADGEEGCWGGSISRRDCMLPCASLGCASS